MSVYDLFHTPCTSFTLQQAFLYRDRLQRKPIEENCDRPEPQLYDQSSSVALFTPCGSSQAFRVSKTLGRWYSARPSCDEGPKRFVSDEE